MAGCACGRGLNPSGDASAFSCREPGAALPGGSALPSRRALPAPLLRVLGRRWETGARAGT